MFLVLFVQRNNVGNDVKLVVDPSSSHFGKEENNLKPKEISDKLQKVKIRSIKEIKVRLLTR